MARAGRNNNIVLIHNLSFGWIRAEWLLSYGEEYVDFATRFKPVDYVKIAEGFGLRAYLVEGPGGLGPTLREAFGQEPTFTEVRVLPEDELVPPVPSWVRKAEREGLRHIR